MSDNLKIHGLFLTKTGKSRGWGMDIKARIKLYKDSDFLLKRSVYWFALPFWRILQFFRDARFRAERVTRFRYNFFHHQGSTFTMLHRYPVLFRACAAYFSAHPNPKILSFGCSTGEEVVSLAEYLPTATIMGVDINEWCLSQCRKNNKNQKHNFYHRLSPEFVSAEGFDAIFCMAVFQRSENRINHNSDADPGFTFENFEQEIQFLDVKLKSGGLFIIDQADFSFADTALAARYVPLDIEKNRIVRNRPLFDKDNKKCADSQYLYRVFVKTSHSLQQ
ncbi:MAG: class I SAM-dependent methyltransferase [Magnetococcales bacterium]|nr:methyltransferase domain-containing protein [Magnetococcales bacterium]NGZ28763.1 class I SAM-dependent methyltransferase [Magnetococcales bacterium]